MNVKQGDPIPLALQMTDGSDAYYPQAVIWRSDTLTQLGSPVNVPAIANGLYAASGPAMPSVPVFVQWIVYSDPSRTIVLQDSRAVDTVGVESSGGGGGGFGVIGMVPDVVAVVDDNEVVAIVGCKE